MSIDQHDDKKLYCRMLGHHLTFEYCRKGAKAQQPCRKIFDCWFEKFDIEKFAKEHFTEDQIKAIFTPPKPKMASLIELIQQAQKNADKK